MLLLVGEREKIKAIAYKNVQSIMCPQIANDYVIQATLRVTYLCLLLNHTLTAERIQITYGKSFIYVLVWNRFYFFIRGAYFLFFFIFETAGKTLRSLQ